VSWKEKSVTVLNVKSVRATNPIWLSLFDSP